LKVKIKQFFSNFKNTDIFSKKTRKNV